MEILSLIIPTSNRGLILKSLLLNLNNQLGKFEVIVVDDASTDNTKEIIKKFKSDLKYDLIYLRVKKKIGLPEARNLGIEHSNFEKIGFLDDDCIPIFNDLILRAIKWLNLKKLNIVGIGGPIYFRSNEPRPIITIRSFKDIFKIFKILLQSILSFYEKTYKLCYVNFLAGGNLFLLKEYVKMAGKFDPKFNGNHIHEDTDICLGMIKYGKLVSDPKMPVNHLGINYGGCRRIPEEFYSNKISNIIYLLLKHKKLTHKIILSVIITTLGILKIMITGNDQNNYFLDAQKLNRVNLIKLIFKAIKIGFNK